MPDFGLNFEILSMPAPLTDPVTRESELPPLAHRLVVLVPDAEVDEARLARTIWTLAAPHGLPVLFLGLGSNPATEFSARRRLTLLAAMTRDNHVPVETRFKFDADWLPAVREVWRADDLIVCHAEQTLSGWSLGRQPLGWSLVSKLRGAVYILNGFYSPLALPPPNGNRRYAWLSLPLTTALVFFGIQVWVDQRTQGLGWINTGLLISLVLIEFGLIWLWNSHWG